MRPRRMEIEKDLLKVIRLLMDSGLVMLKGLLKDLHWGILMRMVIEMEMQKD